LFQENFIHKASPSGIIAQFPRKSKCFSPTDSHKNKKHLPKQVLFSGIYYTF
jgi:hypothetical protein